MFHRLAGNRVVVYCYSVSSLCLGIPKPTRTPSFSTSGALAAALKIDQTEAEKPFIGERMATESGAASSANVADTAQQPAVDEAQAAKFPWARSNVAVNEPFISLLTRGDFKYDVVKETGVFMNKLGTFPYEEIKGKSFGSQWVSRSDKGKVRRGQWRPKKSNKATEPTEGEAPTTESPEPENENETQGAESGDGAGDQSIALAVSTKRAKIHVLPCTPELWCRSLLHRTQIIYALDAALICFHLDLVPGKVVAESGTGSGSLSLAMARAVAPTGHINTFEFNKDRVDAAARDFEMLGVNSVVTVRYADAYTEGSWSAVEGKCDAVFLDLPNPWRAMKNCVKALKPDVETRICSFSPCIEQVQRTCETLTENGFFQVRTFECLFREFETYRLQERIPKMWEETTNAYQLRDAFNPATKSGSSCVFPEMATHTGYLTFATRFPLLLESNKNE